MVVLIAEDVDDTRELMKLLLEFHGHQVDTAADGQQAILAATARLPDVILMDLRMPVMDGFAAARALRLTPETCTIPIIAVSAYMSDPAWRARAKEAGCTECVRKPVDYDVLAAVLKRVVAVQ